MSPDEHQLTQLRNLRTALRLQLFLKRCALCAAPIMRKLYFALNCAAL